MYCAGWEWCGLACVDGFLRPVPLTSSFPWWLTLGAGCGEPVRSAWWWDACVVVGCLLDDAAQPGALHGLVPLLAAISAVPFRPVFDWWYELAHRVLGDDDVLSA